jgi:hypothetical protein
MKGKWGLWYHHSLSICLSVSVYPVITFEPLSRFYEIQYGGHAIERDLDSTRFIPVASTIPKWRMFKLLRWMQNFPQSMRDHETLFADRLIIRGWTTFNKTIFVKEKNSNVEGHWKFKFVFCFVETTHELVYLGKWSLVKLKIMDISTSFILIIVLFYKAFKYGDSVQICC